MGPGNLTPLEELKLLDQQVDQIQSLAALQPLFQRVDELTKLHSSNFEVQLVAHDVRHRILTRGSMLKRTQPLAAPPAPVPAVTPPPRDPPPPEIPLVASAPVETASSAAPPITEQRPAVKQPVQPAAAKPAGEKKRTSPLIWVLAGLLGLVAVGFGIKAIMDQAREAVQTTPVDAAISTVPPGAQILVDGQASCKSDCVAKLTPGTYQISAVLDGFETAEREFVVTAGQPAAMNLALTPQSPSLRIYAQLTSGAVSIDDQPAGELIDGQFTIDKLAPGPHKVRVTGRNSEASFTVNASPGALPTLDGSVNTKNILAAVVVNYGNEAHVVSSAGPLKLTMNGQEQPAATVEGTQLAGFSPGATEFKLGEGRDQRTLTGTFPASPTVTAFLQTDEEIGTLIVTTGQDDVRVYLDNKEQRRRTQKGQVRLQTIGDVTVRVEKAGFEPLPPQTANVTKGSEVKLNFAMKAIPKVSTLVISGGTAGADVVVGGRSLGTVGGDGGFRNNNIPLGEQVVELRRAEFEPKRFTRTFRPGETVTISAAEATLAAIPVALPPPPPPPPPPKVEPPKPAEPKIITAGMQAFDNPGAWRQEDGIWRHKGAATLTFGPKPHGIFTFSIYMLKGGGMFGGGKVRWVVDYVDSKNYLLFELDETNFWAYSIVNGRRAERKKVPHKQDKSMRVWNIQIDVNPTRIIHKIQGDAGWEELDTWTESGRDFTSGKFGIQVNGSDEVGLSNFTFTGRQY